uniref:GST N-terminal domain-containing protein n=1 Tax=Rhodosorus marinus TaxID=101924 RepID=A0A7S3EJH3_9RHOD|mmetsp:Transcript_37498/g.149569  ORF Transcript_37498/g.149569 Transcript_37498/m.149569 type:complete len:114 (+) Transcript_37498:927-1268(+)
MAKGSKRAPKVVYPERPLIYWGYEPSPFCKVVRERLCEYEIPYLCKTTSRGSRKRAELQDNLGLLQVPYLEDPNTGLALFQSKYILKYLDDVYGPNAENAVDELPADVALVKS